MANCICHSAQSFQPGFWFPSPPFSHGGCCSGHEEYLPSVSVFSSLSLSEFCFCFLALVDHSFLSSLSFQGHPAPISCFAWRDLACCAYLPLALLSLWLFSLLEWPFHVVTQVRLFLYFQTCSWILISSLSPLIICSFPRWCHPAGCPQTSVSKYLLHFPSGYQISMKHNVVRIQLLSFAIKSASQNLPHHLKWHHHLLRCLGKYFSHHWCLFRLHTSHSIHS